MIDYAARERDSSMLVDNAIVIRAMNVTTKASLQKRNALTRHIFLSFFSPFSYFFIGTLAVRDEEQHQTSLSRR